MTQLLFHYTGASALQSIIQTNSFWITRSQYLNDETEQVVIVNLLKTFFKNNHTKMNAEVQEFISASFERYLNDYNYYILSFSESDDSLPLWNYYSQNDGYNIGLERDELLKMMEEYFKRFDKENQVIITKVEYIHDGISDLNDKINSKINELLLPFILFTTEDLMDPSKEEKVMEAMLELANMSFILKNSAYYSEKEERIVVITKKDSNLTKEEEFRAFKGAFIPYIIFNKDRSSDYKLPIKKIRLSPYHTLKMSKNSILYMLNHNGYRDIIENDITKSVIPSRY